MKQYSSAAFPNAVLFLDVIPLVDGSAVHFSPGVRLERLFLRSEHHPGLYTVSAQNPCCDGGALQALHPLWVPNAGIVDGIADLHYDIIVRRQRRYLLTTNKIVRVRKVVPESEYIKGQQDAKYS
jgi:hypothetical protein